MHKISAVGLFCYDKFEETPKQKINNMSKLNKFYFSYNLQNVGLCPGMLAIAVFGSGILALFTYVLGF